MAAPTPAAQAGGQSRLPPVPAKGQPAATAASPASKMARTQSPAAAATRATRRTGRQAGSPRTGLKARISPRHFAMRTVHTPTAMPDQVCDPTDCSVTKAQELRAYAVAFELEGEAARCLRCYKDEVRVWRQLLAGTDPDDTARLREYVLELARASEGLARCYGLLDNEAKVVETNMAVLNAAVAILHEEHPVVAGIKAHLGDSAIIFAKKCEAARAALVAAPEAANYDQNESELWRKRIVESTRQRNEHADEAYEYYSDAIVTFRVNVGLLGGGPARETPTQANLQPVSEEADMNGPFGSHVAHCLAKICEGFLVSERAELADKFRLQAEQQYLVYSDRYDSLARHESDGDSTLGGKWDLTMPYLQGYDYDPQTLTACASLAPASDGMGAHVAGTLRRIGGALDRGVMRNAYDTWTPTTDDLDDLLREPELVAPALDAARGEIRGFLEAIERGDTAWMRMLREHPLLAFLGVVDVDSATLAEGDADGLADALVLVDSPCAEEIVFHAAHDAIYYAHLALYSDLAPAEMARCHGNDWRKTPVRIRLPLLTAIAVKNTHAIDMLVGFFVNPNAKSPHDMTGALGTAVDGRDVAIMKRLLQLEGVMLEEVSGGVELSVTRNPLTMGNVLKEVPVAAHKVRRFCARPAAPMPRELLWELIMSMPEHKARDWYSQRATIFFNVLKDDPDATKKCLTAFTGILAPYTASALKHALDAKLACVYEPLLTLVTQVDKASLLATTSDLVTAKLLLEDVHPNTLYKGRPIIAHHLGKRHRDISRYMSDMFSIDEQLLTAEEMEFLDQVVDKWGECLLDGQEASSGTRASTRESGRTLQSGELRRAKSREATPS